MARIKINDLPKSKKIDIALMQRIIGGYHTSGLKCPKGEEIRIVTLGADLDYMYSGSGSGEDQIKLREG